MDTIEDISPSLCHCCTGGKEELQNTSLPLCRQFSSTQQVKA